MTKLAGSAWRVAASSCWDKEEGDGLQRSRFRLRLVFCESESCSCDVTQGPVRLSFDR